MSRRALIIGITGQDGSYLAELLLEKGYSVHGVVRRTSEDKFDRIRHLLDRVTLHQADLLDQFSLLLAMEKAAPDEVYNLAAQSSVPISWSQPVLTLDYTSAGVARLLEAVRLLGRDSIRFYQASSSEMFGAALESPQSERTPFRPRNPYGAAKAYSHWLTVNYRERYGMYCVSGILYNHESPRRGIEFVTRKITDAVARIKLGSLDRLSLGNLDARRDWGYAGDYVKAMWLMLQQPNPEDFVIGTGRSHAVRQFCELAFSKVDLRMEDHVMISPALFREADPVNLVADARKAREQLGWTPTVGIEELVERMVDADLARHRRER